jgi:hypothetical protein
MIRGVNCGIITLAVVGLITGVVSCGGGGGGSSSPVISDAAVCTVTGDQYSLEAVSDGSGGAVVAWIDERPSNSFFKVFTQRINASSGNGLWATDGVPARAATGDQFNPQVVYDGSSGGIYVWSDTLDLIPGAQVYAQKLDLVSGAPQWAVNGVAAKTNMTNNNLKAAPDGSGGILITGMVWPPGPGNASVFAQRLAAASGTPQWSAQGVELCSTVNNPKYPQIAPDGSGGAVVAWHDDRSGDYNIYAQKSDASNGAPQWTANGEAVSTTSGDQEYPMIIPDGAGGVIITWQDSRNGDYDIFAQRIDLATGTPQWAVDGVAVCATGGDQVSPMIVPDGSGGAVITWQDGRNADDDIYAQRINMASGASQWTPEGVVVCAASEGQETPRIINDGVGDIIISWEDFRGGGNYDIYVQKIDMMTGAVQWGNNGMPVSVRSGNQTEHRIVPNGSGGAIIVWKDDRSVDEDIYAQEIRSNGTR